jgi:WD40 repeat protein
MAFAGIFIGVNALQLRYAESDAERLAATLASFGYQCSKILGFSTEDAVLDQIRKVTQPAKETDTVIFFFSGHGLIHRGDLSLVLSEEVFNPSKNIFFSDVLRVFRRSAARQKLLILDCCNAGNGADSLEFGRLDDGIHLLTSGKRLQTAKEIESKSSGLLAWSLCEALKENNLRDVFDLAGGVRINPLSRKIVELVQKLAVEEDKEVERPCLLGDQLDNIVVLRLPEPLATKMRTEREKTKKIDWGGAPELRAFFGRREELADLHKWLVAEKAKLVAIVGLRGAGKTQISVGLTKGGIGKTELTRQLAETLQSEFEFIFWRSLLNSPPLTKILSELILHIRENTETQRLPESPSELLETALPLLAKHRCLVVLDNFDTVLSGAGYQSEREDYGKLLSFLVDASHRSSVLITSREIPPEFEKWLHDPFVRLLPLGPLGVKETKKLFALHGEFTATDQQWLKIATFYRGNPLALTLVAGYIHLLLGGDVGAFLEKGEKVFERLRDLLNWHWERLSDGEKELARWLAVNREAVSFDALQKDMVPGLNREHLGSLLQSLRRKLPVEVSQGSFTLQPVLMEHISEDLSESVAREIQTGQLDACRTCALLKATAKDFIREAQHRLILSKVRDRLLQSFGTPSAVETQIVKLLGALRSHTGSAPSYAAGNLLNLLCSLPLATAGYDFSGLAVWQAYLQGRELHDVNFAGADLSDSVFTEVVGSVFAVCFNPNGTCLASADSTEAVTLWRMPHGVKTGVLTGHRSWVRSIAFSPSGQRIASVADDGQLILWDAKGERLACAKHSHYALRAVCFRDEATVVSAGLDGTISVWAVPGLTALRSPEAQAGGVRAAAISPDGRWLATGGDGGKVRITSLETLERVVELSIHSQPLRALAFSPNGAWLATGGDDALVHRVRVTDWQVAEIHRGHTNQIRGLAFDREGDRLASVALDATVRVWNLRDPGRNIQLQQREHDRLWSAAFSPGGETLVTGSLNKSIRIWSLQSGEVVRVLQGYTNGIKGVTWAGPGRIFAGSDDGCVRLWSKDEAAPVACQEVHRSLIWAVDSNPHAQLAASASDDTSIAVFDLSSRVVVGRLEGHSYAVTAVSFAPGGDELFSGGVDSMVFRWSIAQRHAIKSWCAPGRIWAVKCSPDGSLVAAGCDDGTLHILDARELVPRRSIRVSGVARKLAWHPTAHCLAVVAEEEGIVICNVDGNRQSIIPKPDQSLADVSFIADGEYLACGARDGTVYLWRVSDGSLVQVQKKHTARIWSLSYDSVTDTLATASEDESIWLWRGKSLEPLHRITIAKPYEGMKIGGAIGLTDAQRDTLVALGAIG